MNVSTPKQLTLDNIVPASNNVNVSPILTEDVLQLINNYELVPYGIQNENSHIRAHVCPVVGHVYFYYTKRGVEAIKIGHHKIREAYQSGYNKPTALGYLVPPDDIQTCTAIRIKKRVWDRFVFDKSQTLSLLGSEAVKLVIAMARQGMIPFQVECNEVIDIKEQIYGADIITLRLKKIYSGYINIQVKCDYPGGHRELGGTGNLYLQIAEKNPFKQH